MKYSKSNVNIVKIITYLFPDVNVSSKNFDTNNGNIWKISRHNYFNMPSSYYITVELLQE